VKGLFDFEELAKRALGANWKSATADQQKEFVPLFSQPIIDNYLSQLEGRSSKGFSVAWGKETITGSEAVVESNVKGKTAEGKPVDINVKYFLIQKGSSWMVYDVVTDESSILEVQKETYKKAFKKEKTFDAVLTKLKSKAKK
jgi:phospholipid transport system substrate-binding protein